MAKCKCQFPAGIDIRLDGVNKLDPCVYKRREEHRNVTVFLDQCIHCGHIEISWRPNQNTKTIIHAEMDQDDEADSEDEFVIQRSVDPDDDDCEYDDEEDDEWLDNPD